MSSQTTNAEIGQRTRVVGVRTEHKVVDVDEDDSLWRGNRWKKKSGNSMTFDNFNFVSFQIFETQQIMVKVEIMN